MATYFDTSAVVPLFISEPTTQRCRDLWSSSHLIVASALVEAELHAALAQAHRMDRIGADDLRNALGLITGRLVEVARITVSEKVVTSASSLAVRHGLRGYDAVHLASALLLSPSEVLFVTGDRHLREAAAAEGLLTADTHLGTP